MKTKWYPVLKADQSNWLIKACEEWLEPIRENQAATMAVPDKWEAKHQIILYDYQPDRKHMQPEEFLKGFSGYLHTDGHEGYHKLPENITVISVAV